MESDNKSRTKPLGQFLSTAICGNDILSSVLYVAAIAIVFAGVLAPIVLLIVAVVLFFYKSVYTEVVGALPVNGGTYNALLNGTSKTLAALAGVMSILSYTATAVISASTAVTYLFQFLIYLSQRYAWAVTPAQINAAIIPTVILILLFFAVLVISGIKGSAKIALIFFITHICVLILFILLGTVFLSHHGLTTFTQNVSLTKGLLATNGGIGKILFLGFAASLLGISGFESSANFVEEQQKGVFTHTLRNMLLGVVFFNPIIALVILTIINIPTIISSKNFLLAVVSNVIGGIPLSGVIAIDAFFVLCGAVLTAFISVSGLLNRMTLDECLPSFLIKQNKNHAHPRIVITFFLLCTAILLLTRGNLLYLAGVYTISFLGDMTLFAIGSIILRQTRKELKRPYKAPFFFIVAAALGTTCGIIGNMLLDKSNIFFFLCFFIPGCIFVLCILNQRDILKSLYEYFKSIPPIRNFLERHYLETIDRSFYVFINHPNRLYQILQYIAKNENGYNITFIHCANGDPQDRIALKDIVPAFKKAGAFENFNFSYDYMTIPFGPEAINTYAKEKNIPKNRIFIGSIHQTHWFNYEDLGGVRIIS